MIRAVNLQGAVCADEMNNRVRFCNGANLSLSFPLSLSFLRNKNKTRENTPCEKIFLISFSSNASEQNYRIEGSTESSFIVIRDNKSMNYGYEL